MTGALARKIHLRRKARRCSRTGSRSETKRRSAGAIWSRGQASTRGVMRASRDVRPDGGLDTFMPSILMTTSWRVRAERMGERVQRVEREADMKVQQLDSIVTLDEAQRDRVFAIMARNSREYDPAMVLEGATGEIGATPSGNPNAAMLSVLRADQRLAYDKERERRRDEAAKEMESIGLALPPTWEMLGDGFR